MNVLRILVPITLLAVIGLAFVTFLLAPLKREQEAVKHAINQKLEEKVALEQRLSEIALSAPATALREDIQWTGPEQADAAFDLQAQSVELAQKSGLQLRIFHTIALSTQPTERPRIGLEMEGQGELSRFYAFLNALETAPRKVSVRSLQLRATNAAPSGERGPQIAFRMQVWSYWKAPQ